MHRKSYHLAGDAHFLTFSIYRNFPLFADPEIALLFLRKLNLARNTHSFEVWSYVLMPDHVHLLIWSELEDFPISRALQAMKQPFATALLERLRESNDPRLSHLQRSDKAGKREGRVWQKGGGYDRNMLTEHATQSVLDYIHQNPVQAGLTDVATDYRWSSARWYLEEQGDFRIDLPKLA